MSAWYNGYAEPKEMVKQGYKLISIPDGLIYIVPAAGYYYDYSEYQISVRNWTLAHVGKAVFEEKDPAILGGMFAVWNDHVGNGISVKDIHHRLFPAFQTLAVKTWDAKVTVPYAEFDANRQLLSEAPGVNQMGKIGKKTGLVHQKDEVRAGELCLTLKLVTDIPYRLIWKLRLNLATETLPFSDRCVLSGRSCQRSVRLCP